MKSTWVVEFPNDAVEAEFLDTPKDLQARLVRITDLIESYGLESLGMPYVRHLQDKLWERQREIGDCQGTICGCGWQKGCYPEGVCKEENAEDAAGRNYPGTVSYEGDRSWVGKCRT